MSQESIFEQAGKQLLELLQKELVPAVLNSADAIKLTFPGSNTDFRLGLFLHDMEEVRPYGSPGTVTLNERDRRLSDRIMALRFLVFANHKAPFDSMDAADEMILLEAALRAIHSLRTIEIQGQKIKVEFHELTRGEKSALWQSLGTSLQPAVYLTLEPIVIPSTRILHTVPVCEVVITTHRKEAEQP